MKKLFIVGLFLITDLGWVRADSSPPIASSSSVSSVINSSAPSATSITVSTQPLREMTERVGGQAFYTLARSSFPVAQLPTSAEVVTPGRFTALDAQNAGDLLSQKTDLQSLLTGGLGTSQPIGIRGGDPRETLVLIDGRPANGVSLGATDLSEIPTEMIDHIEVLRGGASALYGPNAMGGVINIITKRSIYSGQPISHVSFDEGANKRQTYRLDFGSRYGPFDYFFFGDQAATSGFRTNADERSHTLGGNAGYAMGGAGKLVFDISSYHRNAGEAGDERFGSSPTARKITDNNYVRSSYILPLPHDTLMTLRLFGSQRTVEFDDAGNPNPLQVSMTNQQEQSHGGELQYKLPLGLMVGGTFIHDREDYADLLTPANSFIHQTENYGIFAQEEFHYDRLTLIPSGRYDHNSQAGETKNPRVQTLADATEWLRFSGSAGRSFRTPTLDELYLNSGGAVPLIGNPALRPESAWTYDGGFELHEDSISFRTTYFRSNVSNLIQTLSTNPTNPNAPFEAMNVGYARRQGAEVQLDHIVNAVFKNSWNYTYLSNRGTSSGSGPLTTLAFSPRHTANYLATVKLSKRWTVDAAARYEDSRFTGNGGAGTKLGSQFVADLKIAYQLRQMELYLGVNDLNDKRYEEQAGFPLAGRTIYGGLRLLLWG